MINSPLMPRLARFKPSDRVDDSVPLVGHDVRMAPHEHEQLVRLVSFLMSGDGTEADQDAALSELEARLPHPRVSGLIYWPSHEGFNRALTAAEVVEEAMKYRPIEL